MLALAGAFFFAFGNVSIFKGAVRKKGDNGVFLSVLMTGLISGLLWVITWNWAPASGAISVWTGVFWFVASGLLTTVFGRILLYKSVQALGVAKAAAVKRLNPLFSVFLAAIILGEAITGFMGIGITLIAVSFAILMRHSLLQWRARKVDATVIAAPPLAFAYGPASALCYAFGYIARKSGLINLPDAPLGTLIGSVAALAYYGVGSIFVADYRRAMREVFTNVNRWQLIAAISVSCGQLLQFAAIQHTQVAKVAMIASLEVFISVFLSVYVMRAEKPPERMTVIAAIVATFGAIFVAIG